MTEKVPFTRYRDNLKPLARHLELDDEDKRRPPVGDKAAERIEIFRNLPLPPPGGRQATWNSVALFFNFEENGLPDGYQETTPQDALNLLDEGDSPADPTLSEWMGNYWRTLSYGNLFFGIDTPRDEEGSPLIPRIEIADGDPMDWVALINACITANVGAIWRAAGSLTINGRRWIPSVFLVQRYWAQASAFFYGYVLEVEGVEYFIGDITHIVYDLAFYDHPDVPANRVRRFWSVLNHEFSHNFLEFGDLYGPAGCTGYWDLLGDNSPPWHPSEVSSVHKQRVDWCEFKRVYEGPNLRERTLSLSPYTTSGEAYKIIPDPDFTPHEYFILEYRKSTGTAAWTPDGAMTEEGLLIIHINERLGIPALWLLRDAPYFDPEFADFSDKGGTLWTGFERLNGIVYPQPDNNAFTHYTNPSSDLYGRRDSGLAITDIRIEDEQCKFRIRIDAQPSIGWNLGERDRFTVGRFSTESEEGGQEIFCRNDASTTLLTQRQAQWLARGGQHGQMDGWQLGENDYELAADLDGDGLDELYIRNHDTAGVLKFRGTAFEAVTIQQGAIDAWGLGPLNWEFKADIDGDGRDEICIRAPQWLGIIKLSENRLDLISIQHGPIGGFPLGENDKEHTGRFTQTEHDEILIQQAEQFALLDWNAHWQQVELQRTYAGSIGTWNLSPQDQFSVGDFDGDGRDEIYIRAADRAGLMKWVGNDFQLVWDRTDDIQPIDSNACYPIQLAADDISYVGQFQLLQDGILHRHANGLAILSFNRSEMQVQHCISSPFSDWWHLHATDKFVLGDFHRIGSDIADPTVDVIIDRLTDIFIHSTSATGMIGINYNHLVPDFPATIDPEIGLTWFQRDYVLSDSSLVGSGCLPLGRLFGRLFKGK